jgi:transposase
VIDNVTPPGKELHLIAENYAAHKHPKVQRWLKRHPRFHMYFTPTSSSWLNMVERFFRDLTEERLRRGIFRDVDELIDHRRLHRQAQRQAQTVRVDSQGI